MLSSFQRITRAATTLVAAAALAVSLTATSGCSSAPKAPAAESKPYAFWPAPPAEPRVQFLVSFQKASDVKEAKGSSKLNDLIYGKEQEVDLPINKPYGVAMWNGRIYVCDIRGAGVVVLDLRQHQTRVMGAKGTSALQRAVDIDVAADGTKYVVDAGKNAVAVFDPAERFVASFNLPDWAPVGAAVSGNELYVCDFNAQVVRVLDRFTGSLVRTLGSPGGEDGQFVKPLSVAVDSRGFVFVADVMRSRVQKFAPDGTFVAAFGQHGNRPGDFVRPKHMKVGPDGALYVVDAAFNNVQCFDEDGKVMGFFGAAGSHPGAMDLPAGLAITDGDLDLFARYLHPAFAAERLVIVTNQFGPQKVSVYAIGGLRPGKTVADVSPGRIRIEGGMQDPAQAQKAVAAPLEDLEPSAKSSTPVEKTSTGTQP